MSKQTVRRLGRVATFVAILAGAATVWAADPDLPIPIPDDFGRWPVVAIMGFITLMALGLAAFAVNRALSISGPLSSLVTQGEEHNRRLDEIAEKQGDNNKRPCAMETPAFREWLREVAGK